MRLIIVSNRAPITVTPNGSGYEYSQSSGGLATGLRAYAERAKEELEIVFVGWPGTVVEDEATVAEEIASEFGIHSVFMSSVEVEQFYDGFCNKTIWPLFHYFPSYAKYDAEHWTAYQTINQRFCDAVLRILRPGDIIWVHDYQLMLLPSLLREQAPESTIGFFLHIPFPSYEIFRLLPSMWRRSLLEGMLGADLIGFHTHDYRTYFLHSVMRVLGIDDKMGEVFFNKRLVKIDTLPMSIDYDKYHSAPNSQAASMEKKKINTHFGNVKTILSIDRQDYSKGILRRLDAYEYFLKTHPEWHQQVVLIMVVVPSRDDVDKYQTTKKEIDEHVGNTNGKYGTLEWAPIHYQYRFLEFSELAALYNTCDVALITPLRDGMNLVAKEYVASRTDATGVLILSEMAGAAEELDEAILINPNNVEETSAAIWEALSLSKEEQGRRISLMQQRIKKYDVFRWADDFLTTLNEVRKDQAKLSAKRVDPSTRGTILHEFSDATSRLIFLDYDGTLTPFVVNPADAAPSEEVKTCVSQIAQLPNTRVVLMSGRDRQTMSKWFSDLPVDMAAEHGLYIKKMRDLWRLLKPVRKTWKKEVSPILNHYAEKLPGAFVEEKEYSLVFHFRKSDAHSAGIRVNELANHLASFTANMDLQLLMGNKILEVRNAGIDKGVAAMSWFSPAPPRPDFILAIGDDLTDEDMFKAMPDSAVTIKVGLHPSHAKYNLATHTDVIDFLHDLRSSAS